MARSNITDPLLVYPFWLMDLGPTDTFNFPIFTPLFGFQTISAPEISAETTDIPEGNWPFVRKILKRAGVGNMTLTRGVFFYDADFWRWMMSGLVGSTAGNSILPGSGVVPLPPGLLEIGGPTYRRNFLLIQYFAKAIFPTGSETVGAVRQAAIAQALGAGAAAFAGLNVSPISLAATAASVGVSAAGVGPFEFAARVPARAWVLLNAIPVRYRTGSDLDAGSSAVSVQEIEIALERFEEVALG